MKLFSKEKILFYLFIIFILAILFISHHFDLHNRFSIEDFRNIIDRAGGLGLLVYVGIYIIASIIPFPVLVLSTASGVVWGAALGTLYTVLTATLASLFPFMIARLLGKKIFQKMRGKSTKATACEQFVSNNGFVTILLMRLLPIFPWDFVNYFTGLCNIRT